MAAMGSRTDNLLKGYTIGRHDFVGLPSHRSHHGSLPPIVSNAPVVGSPPIGHNPPSPLILLSPHINEVSSENGVSPRIQTDLLNPLAPWKKGGNAYILDDGGDSLREETGTVIVNEADDEVREASKHAAREALERALEDYDSLTFKKAALDSTLSATKHQHADEEALAKEMAQTVRLESLLADAEGERDRLASVAETLQQQIKESDEALNISIEVKRRVREEDTKALKARYMILAAQLDDVVVECGKELGLNARWMTEYVSTTKETAGRQVRKKAGEPRLEQMAPLKAMIQTWTLKTLRLESCIAHLEGEQDRIVAVAETLRRQILDSGEGLECALHEKHNAEFKEQPGLQGDAEARAKEISLLEARVQASLCRNLRLHSRFAQAEGELDRLASVAEAMRQEIQKMDKAMSSKLFPLQAEGNDREIESEALEAWHNMLVVDSNVRNKASADPKVAMKGLHVIQKAEVATANKEQGFRQGDVESHSKHMAPLETKIQTWLPKALRLESRLAQVQEERDRLVAVADTLRTQILDSDDALEHALRENQAVEYTQQAGQQGDAEAHAKGIASLERLQTSLLKSLRLDSRFAQAIGELDRLASVAEMLCQQIQKADEALNSTLLLVQTWLPRTSRLESRLAQAEGERHRLVAFAETLRQQISDSESQLQRALQAKHAVEFKEQVGLQADAETSAKEISLLDARVRAWLRKTLRLDSRLAQAEGELDRLASVAETLRQQIQEADEAPRSSSFLAQAEQDRNSNTESEALEARHNMLAVGSDVETRTRHEIGEADEAFEKALEAYQEFHRQV